MVNKDFHIRLYSSEILIAANNDNKFKQNRKKFN